MKNILQTFAKLSLASSIFVLNAASFSVLAATPLHQNEKVLPFHHKSHINGLESGLNAFLQVAEYFQYSFESTKYLQDAPTDNVIFNIKIGSEPSFFVDHFNFNVDSAIIQSFSYMSETSGIAFPLRLITHPVATLNKEFSIDGIIEQIDKKLPVVVVTKNPFHQATTNERYTYEVITGYDLTKNEFFITSFETGVVARVPIQVFMSRWDWDSSYGITKISEVKPRTAVTFALKKELFLNISHRHVLDSKIPLLIRPALKKFIKFAEDATVDSVKEEIYPIANSIYEKASEIIIDLTDKVFDKASVCANEIREDSKSTANEVLNDAQKTLDSKFESIHASLKNEKDNAKELSYTVSKKVDEFIGNTEKKLHGFIKENSEKLQKNKEEIKKGLEDLKHFANCFKLKK